MWLEMSWPQSPAATAASPCLSSTLSVRCQFYALLLSLYIPNINFLNPPRDIFCLSFQWSLWAEPGCQAAVTAELPLHLRDQRPEVSEYGTRQRCQHCCQTWRGSFQTAPTRGKADAENSPLPCQLRVHSPCSSQKSLSSCTAALSVCNEDRGYVLGHQDTSFHRDGPQGGLLVQVQSPLLLSLCHKHLQDTNLAISLSQVLLLPRLYAYFAQHLILWDIQARYQICNGPIWKGKTTDRVKVPVSD